MITIAASTGIALGLLMILVSKFLNRPDKSLFLGLALSGIGFLYVGFCWTHTASLVTDIFQALFFLVLGFLGIKRNMVFLTAGYFLHSFWDLAYGHLGLPDLRPPHYDVFCFLIDFIVGIYLVVLQVNRATGLPEKEVR